MEAIEVKFNVNEMQKSAIIYRNASAQFIYVCYHCGCMFYEILSILSHIESHFEVVNVMVDQVAEDVKEVNTEQIEEDRFAVIFDHIKVEPFDDIYDSGLPASTSVPIHQYDTQITEFRTDSKEFKDDKDNRNMETKKMSIPQKPTILVRRRSKKRRTPYRCHKCPRTCTIALALNNHLKRHKKDGLLHIFKCTKCDQYFKTATDLRFHVLDVHLKDKSLECCACSSKFQIAEKIRFLKHLQWHHGSSKNLNIWLNSRKNACTEYEEVEYFSEEQFPCDLCPKRFFIKSNWNVHMQSIHVPTEPNECSECQAIFDKPTDYYAHQLEHRRVGPHITETNDKILQANLNDLINEHIVHGIESGEQKYRCLLCGITAEKSHDIRGHVRRHVYKMLPPPLRPKKEFICDICGMTFKAKHIISKHFEIHTNTKSHVCTVCGKAFRLKSDRKIHEMRHAGALEKVHQCHECGKTFTTKGILTNHVLTHNVSIPCKVCGKIFKPGTFKGHMETHRVDRPFKCQLCPKTFNTKTYLRRHNETHSSRMHPCRYCASEFNTGDGLRQHYRHKHKDEWQSQKQQ